MSLSRIPSSGLATAPVAASSAQQGAAINAVRETMDTLKAIRTFVKEEMVANLDYGVIPGTGQKPALLQPGAQKTAMYFNATPDHAVEKSELGNGHVEYLVTTRFVSRSTGAVIGMGIGSCSTMESRYRYRNASRACPDCGKDTLRKSKEEGKGYYCWAKIGGCGATFTERHTGVVNQAVGKVENENIHDQRNTVLKMAVKRSFVAAALSMGCLSELFTQDIDETYDLHASAARGGPESPRDARGGSVEENTGRKPDGAHAGTQTPGTWAAWSSRRRRGANDDWMNHLAMRQVAPERRKELVNAPRLVNHVCSEAIACGSVSPEEVTRDGAPDGKRDPEKAARVVATLFGQYPEWVIQVVESHIEDLWGREDRALGLLDPEPPPDSDPAARGREPGGDG